VYHFSPYEVGLTFVPLFVGSLLAILFLGAFDKLTYQKARVAAIRSGTEVKPEKRLYPAMLSAIILPISLFVSQVANYKRSSFLLFEIYMSNIIQSNETTDTELVARLDRPSFNTLDRSSSFRSFVWRGLCSQYGTHFLYIS
jgi:hypothetical protein